MDPKNESKQDPVAHFEHVAQHDRQSRILNRVDESLVSDDVLAPNAPEHGEAQAFHSGKPANEARVQVENRRLTAKGMPSIHPDDAVKQNEETRKKREEKQKKDEEKAHALSERSKNLAKLVEEKQKKEAAEEAKKEADKEGHVTEQPVAPAPVSHAVNDPAKEVHVGAKPGDPALPTDPLHPIQPKDDKPAFVPDKKVEESPKVEAPDGNRTEVKPTPDEIAKKAEEAKAAEAKKVEEQKAADAKKAEEAKKAEDAKKAEEAKKAAEAPKPEEKK